MIWNIFPDSAPKTRQILIRGYWTRHAGPGATMVDYPKDQRPVQIVLGRNTSLSAQYNGDTRWYTDSYSSLESYPYVVWTHWADIPEFDGEDIEQVS